MDTSLTETASERKRRALLQERLALLDSMLWTEHRKKPGNLFLTAARKVAERLLTIVVSTFLLALLLVLSPLLLPLSLVSTKIREFAGTVLFCAVWTLFSH